MGGFDLNSYLIQQNLQKALNAPVPQSPVEKLASFQQQNEPPQVKDFHASIGRKILAGIAGIGGGLAAGSKYDTGKDPAKVAAEIEYAPFIKQQQEYQQKLAPLQAQASEYQKQQALNAQQKVEESHADEFEAQRQLTLRRMAGLPTSPEQAQQFKMDQLKVEHPITEMPKLYDLELGDGNKVVGAQRDKEGNFKGPDGKIYGEGAITSANEQGKPKEVKEPTGGLAGHYRTWYADPKHRKSDGTTVEPPQDQITAWEHEDAEAKKIIVNTGGGSDAKKDAALDREIKQYGAPYSKIHADIGNQIGKINDTMTMIHSGGYTGQNLSQIKILTSLVSGQGTGVRVTKSEIDQITNARGVQGKFEAWLDRLLGQGSLSQQQQKEMNNILSDVKQRLLDKQAIADRASDKMENSNSREDILKADKEARAIQAAMENGTYRTGTKNGKKIYTIDGGKTVIPLDE